MTPYVNSRVKFTLSYSLNLFFLNACLTLSIFQVIPKIHTDTVGSDKEPFIYPTARLK